MSGLMIGISILYGGGALGTIALMYRNRQRQYVTAKTATSLMFLLIGYLVFLQTENPLYWKLLPAFLLCFLGDVLLALAHEIDNKLKNPQFMLGVGAFLLAHIFFCWQFFIMLNWRIGWPALMALAMTVVTIFSVRSPKYDYGSNKIPSVIYSFFVGLLCGLGWQLMLQNGLTGQNIALGVGGTCFLLSDYLLSLKYFRLEKPRWLGFGVLTTYYGAMWLLSANLLF